MKKLETTRIETEMIAETTAAIIVESIEIFEDIITPFLDCYWLHLGLSFCVVTVG